MELPQIGKFHFHAVGVKAIEEYIKLFLQFMFRLTLEVGSAEDSNDCLVMKGIQMGGHGVVPWTHPSRDRVEKASNYGEEDTSQPLPMDDVSRKGDKSRER